MQANVKISNLINNLPVVGVFTVFTVLVLISAENG